MRNDIPESSRRCRIGIFLDNFYPAVDGVALVADSLAKKLSEDHDVVLVVPDTSSRGDDADRPYRVKRIRSFSLPTAVYCAALPVPGFSKTFRDLMREHFDIIHIHSPFAVGRLGVRIAERAHIPVVGTLHTRFDMEFDKRFRSRWFTGILIRSIVGVYERCDRCITVNRRMTEVLKGYGYRGDPVVIRNGTDLKPTGDREEACRRVNERFGIGREEPLLLFVGRIISIKNIFFLLDALRLLKEDGYPYRMIYVGEGPDLKELRRRIRACGLDREVITAGGIEDRGVLSALYARADLLVFPSLFDASSLVQIEAAVHETPGLFLEGAVTADTVVGDVSGYTSERDVRKYGDRIKEILGDREKLREVSVRAGKMLGRTAEEMTAETCELYRTEIRRKREQMLPEEKVSLV